MVKKYLFPVLMLCLFILVTAPIFAQPLWTVNLLDSSKRSKKFEERKLGSEKMAEKKFTVVRHIFQNNYTHYNYYYNAHNKINFIIDRAKAIQKDDYTKLLPYYPYHLDNTASQKTELDSVITKATAGILLHDLRNDWVDNMYLLMGQAYFFKKQFDSAAATFQFINYNLFPRKKDEEDNRIVGTRDASSNGSLSIANKEKRNILQKLTAEPPSRNDALIWMTRTLIEQNELGEAAALINTLQQDPNLPQRLADDLAEVNAYWFYKQNMYDSAAGYVKKSLTNNKTKQDLARSEFLLAQLYEMDHQYDKAGQFYNNASQHTTSPLMDIYAQLNSAKMMKGTSPKELQASIDNLVHLAKKDKFEPYRYIIFYSAGDLAFQKPDTSEAVFYYNKSLQFNATGKSFKNNAFLKLADIAFNRQQFKLAYNLYDSIKAGDSTLTLRIKEIQARKNSLAKIVEKLNIIGREDSLQQLAVMPEAERNALVKKMARQFRKEKGLAEEENNGNDIATIKFDSKQNTPIDLFANGTGKGEWYFDNASLKAKGQADFKSQWGNRSNTDNWRRKNAMSVISNTNAPDVSAIPKTTAITETDKTNPVFNSSRGAKPLSKNEAAPENLSFEGLMGHIPLTPEKLAASNNKIAVNLFELAKLYQTELEDYPLAIITYHQSLLKFPDSLYNGDLYLGLYYCYNKLGDTQKAAFYKNLINKNFKASKANKILIAPQDVNPSKKNEAGTKRYEGIYNLFIEGRFADALAEKLKADSLYGNNFWSPQLLYIEAVYQIKQRHDSIAIDKLVNITALYPHSPLSPKAERMIDVLKRRKSIEAYLTDLVVTRVKDEVPGETPTQPVSRNDNNLIATPRHFLDSSKTIIGAIHNPGKDSLQKQPVAKAIVAADSTKKISLATDSIIKILPVPDSIKTTPPVLLTNGLFTFNAATPQNVIMVLDKVDGTYVNESKNAFSRYLGERFRGQPIGISKASVDKDISLLVFSSFPNAEAALQFTSKIKKAAPEEISWLPAAKYTFLIISDDNLQLLINNKNLKAYKMLLNKQYPGKF